MNIDLSQLGDPRLLIALVLSGLLFQLAPSSTSISFMFADFLLSWYQSLPLLCLTCGITFHCGTSRKTQGQTIAMLQ